MSDVMSLGKLGALARAERDQDEVVGIAAISDHFIVATKRGKLYRVSKDDQDMVKLWVEIPV